MALTDNKITDTDISTHGVVSAPDKLTGTAAQNKAVFDNLIKQAVKMHLNALIDDLVATSDGASGADNIGATAIKAGGAVTVQGQLEGLQADKAENADLLTHKSSADHDGRYYTKTELQTTGSSTVHWGNLTNVPNLADGHWKPPVADKASLPLTGNSTEDCRVVLDDGDGKQAVYLCIAITGTLEQQWKKIGDVDWITEEATRVTQENARVVAETGRVDAEASRATAENARVGAETARNNAEGLRVTAETGRNNAETGRVNAETTRVNAENARAVFEAYDNATAYIVGNKVSYNGSSYICTANTTGNLPTNTAYWLLIASKGDIGAAFTYADFTPEQLALLKGATGAKGNGISSIIRTSGTGAAGTTDTYTITFTDSSTATFTVYNGADGEGSGDMLANVYDPNSKNTDAFDMDNMVNGTTNKVFTATEKTKLAGIAAGAEVNVNADWNAVSGDAQILNKPTLATVATSGSYNDLSNKPSIPAASSAVTATLAAASWIGSVAPYTQTVTVSGMTASKNFIVGAAANITDSQFEAMGNAKLRVSAQSTNTITITAMGDKPAINLPISVTLLS